MSPIPALRGRLSGYWIGGLPVYQAGGPPLGFEKTGLSLLGLRGGVSGTQQCHSPLPISYSGLPLTG